jgi:hypothetical protein
MDVTEIDLETWDASLPKSGYEVFHDPAALSVLDEYGDGTLRLMGGFKGEQRVGLFPAFVNERPVGTTVTSPPPSMGVPRLGPIVMPTSPKQRKREAVNKQFVESVVDELGVTGRGSLARIVTGRGYDDPRPLSWAGLDLDARFTYAVDVSDRSTEDVLAAFSRSLRREVRDARDSDVIVETGGTDAARSVYDATVERYEAQDRTFTLSWPYVRDLVTALDDRARVYLARSPEGEFLSGITVLYGPDAAYFWQGGTRTRAADVAVNSLLHWRVITDLIEDDALAGVDAYDLVGANTKRLCDYKGKFAGSLVPYYIAETEGLGMAVAKRAYATVTR